MKTPYFGITDFSEASQVVEMLKVFLANRKPGSLRKLMVGVMMSYKTLHKLTSNWLGIYPDPSKLAEIFQFNDPALMNTLHYADKEGIDVLNSLLKAVSFCGPHLHALQLDMVWPEPYILYEFRRVYPNIQIVLQVDDKSFDIVHSDPSELVGKLLTYGDSLDYVLLDKSMGRGLGMDAKFLRPFVIVWKHLPRLGIGVGGGLGPGKFKLVSTLVAIHSGISLDAQGCLRSSGKAYDPIEWDLATQYIEEFVPLLD